MKRFYLTLLAIAVITLACGVSVGSVSGSVSSVIVRDTPCPIVGTLPVVTGNSNGK